MSKDSSLTCLHLPARQLKRKYATPQRCRNYNSIQECSVHGDIYLFALAQPTAECHSLQDKSSSQWWTQGTHARTLLTSWHLHVTPLCHISIEKKASAPSSTKATSWKDDTPSKSLQIKFLKEVLKEKHSSHIDLSHDKAEGTHNSLVFRRHVVVSAVKDVEKSIVHYKQVCSCRLQNLNGLYGCSEVNNFLWYILFLFNFQYLVSRETHVHSLTPSLPHSIDSQYHEDCNC